MSKDLITTIILAERQRMIDDGEVDDFVEINSGQCEDFALKVVAIFNDQASTRGTPEIGSFEINNFFQINPQTGFAFEDGGSLDRELLARYVPHMNPPPNMTWDDLDAFIAETGIGWGLHVFIVCGGLVYDSEAPEGVESIFDLPLFQRFLERWEARKNAALAETAKTTL